MYSKKSREGEQITDEKKLCNELDIHNIKDISRLFK